MKKVLVIILTFILSLSLVACINNAETTDGNQAKDATVISNVNETAEQEAIQNESSKESIVSESKYTNGDKITVYLSGPEGMIKKLEETFEADRGDVADFVIMSCGQVRSKTWTEKEAGQVQADVIWGSDPLLYYALDKEGLLEKVKINDKEHIADGYSTGDHNFYYLNERYVTLMYNKDYITEAPTSFADLTKEAYKGKVVIADGSQSATAFAITASVYQLMDNQFSYFEELKKNDLMLVKSNGLVPSSILEGQFDVGIGPYDAVVRLKNKGKKEGYDVPLEAAWAKEGTIAIQRPVAMSVKTTRNEVEDQTARELVNFLLSKKAQNITMNFGFVSVRDDVENKYLPKGEVFKVDWESLAKEDASLKNLYQETFHE